MDTEQYFQKMNDNRAKFLKENKLTTLTLKEWVEGNYKEGWSACSLNINSAGFHRFDSCSRGWWIRDNKANGSFGQSWCGFPDMVVYVKTQK